jgi:hypothetical protein
MVRSFCPYLFKVLLYVFNDGFYENTSLTPIKIESLTFNGNKKQPIRQSGLYNSIRSHFKPVDQTPGSKYSWRRSPILFYLQFQRQEIYRSRLFRTTFLQNLCRGTPYWWCVKEVDDGKLVEWRGMGQVKENYRWYYDFSTYKILER